MHVTARRICALILTLFALSSAIVAPTNAAAEESSIADHIVLRSAELNWMWGEYFAAVGLTHTAPTVVVVLPTSEAQYAGLYSDNVQLVTEPARSYWGDVWHNSGSFYDFHNQTMFLSYNDIVYQWTTYGDFAASFLIAHEWGHHISNQMYTPDFGSLYNVGPQNMTFFELQADCYVGLYASWVSAFNGLEVGDVEEAYTWAGTIGSDVGGNTDATTWTHGSSEQRMESFWHGYSTNQCEAYSGLSGAPLTGIQACQNASSATCGTETAGRDNNQVWAAGWYDPYGYGCLYWYDGRQYTEYVDCNGDGQADTGNSSAGWYGPYSDGCRYWWDGAQWTGHVDCDGDGYADPMPADGGADCQNPIAVPCDQQGGEASSAAGWYGPADDGCNYWWDGTGWSGHVDCDGDGYADNSGSGNQGGADCQNPIAVPCDEQENMGEQYAAGWYGPYEDGCNHWWTGVKWSGDVDCDGDGYADRATDTSGGADCQNPIAVPCDEQGRTGDEAGWYGPDEYGCYYWWDGAQFTGSFDCDSDGYADTVDW